SRRPPLLRDRHRSDAGEGPRAPAPRPGRRGTAIGMSSRTEPLSSPQSEEVTAAPFSFRRRAGSRALSGFILGMLGWIAADMLRLTDALPFLRSFEYAPLLAA